MDGSPAFRLGKVRVPTAQAMLIAAGVAALIAVFGETDPISWITVLFAIVGLVPWVLEASGARLQPLAFLLLTMLPAAAVVLVDGNPGGLFPVLLAVVWITRRRSSRAMVAVGLTSAVAMTIGCGVADQGEIEGVVYFLGGVGTAWFSGVLLRRQDSLVDELREATARERARAAVEERTRIAREVHDVIAHSLTVTILHVTGARRALTTGTQQVAEALERAELVGRESLDSIRQVVGLLRDAEDTSKSQESSTDTPLPVLSNIPALIAKYREAGLEIRSSFEPDGLAAGAMTSLTVFRLVQEGMTNALRHAPGAPVSLSISGDTDRSVISVRVENPLGAVTTRRKSYNQEGLGLRGMVERVRACGGSIEIGPTASGTWLIAAELPLDLTLELL